MSSSPPLCLLSLLPSMLTANSQQQAPLQRGLMAVWAWHSAHCVCKLVIRIVAATVAAPCRVVILITSACLPVLFWPLPCFSLSLFLSVCLPVPLPVCLSVCLSVYRMLCLLTPLPTPWRVCHSHLSCTGQTEPGDKAVKKKVG